jgi:transposase
MPNTAALSGWSDIGVCIGTECEPITGDSDMVGLGSTHRYYVYQGVVDMRKSFDGLQGLVVNELGRTGMEGEVYVFFNGRRTQVKLLVWDRSGFVIYYKRLERGSFERYKEGQDGGYLSLSWSELQMLLEGIVLRSIQRRLRYERA